MIRWLATLALAGLAGTAAAQDGCGALRDPGAVAAAAGGPEARAAVQAGLRGRVRRGRPRPQRRGDRAGDALLSRPALRPGAARGRHRSGRRHPRPRARIRGALARGRRLDRAHRRSGAARGGDRRLQPRRPAPRRPAADFRAGAGRNQRSRRLRGARDGGAGGRPGRPRAVAGGPRGAASTPIPTWRRSASRRKRRRPGSRWSASAPPIRPAGRRRWWRKCSGSGDIAAAVPGALATLASPQFARWLEASQAVRLGRLLGTVPAVVRLLQDYLAEAGPVTVAEVPGCEPPDAAAMPTWFALDPADLEKLAARATLQAALAPVAAERFADRDALVGAVNGVLGLSLPDCGARRVEATVARHEDDATVYALDPEGLQHLALVPDLADVLPAAPAAGGGRERQPRGAGGRYRGGDPRVGPARRRGRRQPGGRRGGRRRRGRQPLAGHAGAGHPRRGARSRRARSSPSPRARF